jgi:hypothetical protein
MLMQPGAPELRPDVSQPRPTLVSGRRRRAGDRRAAFHDFLAFLSGGLSGEAHPRALRLRFEEGLRKLVPARALGLRQGPLDSRSRAAGAELLSLDVPGAAPDAVRIEALFDPASGLDDWDLQMLQTARYIAALVVEIERARVNAPFRRARPAESFPLVGSSREIAALRERIAQVAATDFTVLIEGAIDPEPHPAAVCRVFAVEQ